MVMPKHEELKEALEFQASELRKYFTQGDHVKVNLARYRKLYFTRRKIIFYRTLYFN